MNQCTMELMKKLVNKHCPNYQKVLDIGSYDVNGCFKDLFRKGTYTGLDMRAGPNVDLVPNDIYKWTEIPDKSYDLVISGCCLEHIEAPWLTMKEIDRVCSGHTIHIAPWLWRIHPYPQDCWRILPDGMKYMLTKWCNFDLLECDTACDTGPMESLCYGVGVKR